MRTGKGHRVKRALRWADAALRAERCPAGAAPQSTPQTGRCWPSSPGIGADATGTRRAMPTAPLRSSQYSTTTRRLPKMLQDCPPDPQRYWPRQHSLRLRCSRLPEDREACPSSPRSAGCAATRSRGSRGVGLPFPGQFVAPTLQLAGVANRLIGGLAATGSYLRSRDDHPPEQGEAEAMIVLGDAPV